MFDHAGEILILTGPPGSGKTTTSAALARLGGSPKVHLHADDFWHFIKQGAVEPYLPEAHAQNRVVIDVLATTARTYAGGGYFVVLDGIIGPWFLNPFGGLTVPVHYVVLRPPLDVAIRRCQARGGSELSDPGPIAALHAQLSDLGALQRHAIATGEHAREDLLDLVTRAVASGAFVLPRRAPGTAI